MSVGTGLVAMIAAQTAGMGVGLEDVARLATDLAERVHVHAVIEAVDYLRHGGRAGLLDTVSVKRGSPQLIAVRGHVILLHQVRDRDRATHDLLRHIARDHLRHGVDRWAVGHGDAADVDLLLARALEVFGTPPAFVTLLGPAVGTPAGPDALVVGLIAGQRG